MTQAIQAVDVTPHPLALMARLDVRVQSLERRVAALEQPALQAQAVEKVLRAVAERFGIPRELIKDGGRDRPTVRARWVAMYVMHRELELSLAGVAAIVGGRDTKTVWRAVNQVEVMLSADVELRRDVDLIRRAIGGINGEIGAHAHTAVVDGAGGSAEAAALERLGEGH